MSPMKSEAQRRYLHAKKPKIAKEFESKTKKGKKLPRKVKKRKSKMSGECENCGEHTTDCWCNKKLRLDKNTIDRLMDMPPPKWLLREFGGKCPPPCFCSKLTAWCHNIFDKVYSYV